MPSPVLPLASRPWALVLRMMRRSRWGVRSCGCGYWLLVGVTPSLASSAPSLLFLRWFTGSLSPPSFSLFSSTFPLPFLPHPCLRARSRPCPRSRPHPVPVPVTVFSLLSLGPGFPLGTTSSDRRRVLRPKLLATNKRHILSTEMMFRAEWRCLIFYSSSFLM